MIQILYFEANLNNDILKIGIRTSERPIWRYEEKSLFMDDIKIHCRMIAEMLNKKSRKDNKDSRTLKELKGEGRMLCDSLLTPVIKEYLMTAAAEYLILSLDDHLVHIPWELLLTGDKFLCQRFNIGRQVRTRQIIPATDNRILKKPLKIWILANPCGDLPNAGLEGMEIFRYTVQKREFADPYLRSDIKADHIRLNIKEYDFVHFAGHADYHPAEPGSSGWRLTDDHFTADDIYKIAGGSSMPLLVFSNACQSARTEAWEDNDDIKGSFGLANAFLSAGVKHYVGTFWEITDKQGSFFALEFYKYLFSGKTIGVSIREARERLIEKYGEASVGWASYLLYGDPGFSYFNENKKPEEYMKSGSCTQTSDDNKKRGIAAESALHSRREKAVRQNSSGTWRYLSGFLLSLLVVGLGYTGISEYFRLELAKLMQKEAQRKETQIHTLLEKIEKKIPAPASDQKDSESLTMAVLYDSMKIAWGEENMISSAIEMEIREKFPQIKLVERKAFNLILEELNLSLSSLVQNGLHPRLLNARFILFIETEHSFFKTFVLIRMSDTETGESFAFPVKELKSGRIASQNLAEDVLTVLKKISYKKPDIK